MTENTSTVDTAVIMAAGRGSRRAPITRAIDKAMIPIGNRPTIDYVVEQCAYAGVRSIIVTVNDHDTTIKRYYQDEVDIAEEYPWLNLSGKMTFTYVTQDGIDAYGTGAAMLAVEPHVRGRFFVLASDAFFDDIASVKNMIDKGRGGPSVLGLMVRGHEARNYGVIEQDEKGYLRRLREKPDDLRTDIKHPCYMSYALLDDTIFETLHATELENNELYLTTAIQDWDKPVAVVPTDAAYMDNGRLQPWIQANVRLFGDS